MEVDFSEDTPILNNVGVRREENVEDNSREWDEKQLINCLRDERIIVRFVPSEKGLITDPKHVLYGGLGETSKRRFVVPLLPTGVYKNVLTNSEKDYLEYIMGLPQNAMSVYKKQNNFWENRHITLGKEPTILHLSVPDDYIRYKILLANPDFIAPSEEVLKLKRKATYQYVITKEGEQEKKAVQSLTITSEAFIIFGEYKEDLKRLATIVEEVTGKVVSRITKEFVYSQVETAIKDFPEQFIRAAKDPYLDTKILIKEAIEAGYVRKRGLYYYLTEGNSPLCTEKQEPTLQSACEYLNAPKYQEVLFTLQSKVNSK